ncbi:MAG: alpha/beta hydrolase [Gammaproteobacteria bacterium]|nr:alpha/beta hydrolase [Gammaproteobacteria bacterium]
MVPSPWSRRPAIILVILGALVVGGGCAAPSGAIQEQARDAGFEAAVRQGTGFRHVVFRGRPLAADGILHVYLGGDGRAWVNPRRIALDPTPDESLVLKLMARDPGAAVMVGRPCYHGLARDEGCAPAYWTGRRYSPEVVASLAAVIEDERREPEGVPARVILVGHSGGGTLAVLVAEVLDGVAGVITLAGNLDLGAWTRHHGYSALEGSLDPARRPPLPPGMPRLHLVGEKDENVLAEWTRRFVAARSGARMCMLSRTDHRCCWVDVWPLPVCWLGDDAACEGAARLLIDHLREPVLPRELCITDSPEGEPEVSSPSRGQGIRGYQKSTLSPSLY